MGIKFCFILLLVASSVWSQGTEEQHKYTIPESVAFQKIIDGFDDFSSLKTHFHSNYTYYDLYIDDSSGVLFRNGYSLRFRKRILDSNELSYAFQLKSEATVSNSVRIEIEETELDFYRVKDGEQWHSLASVLDSVFNYCEREEASFQTEKWKHWMSLIQDWIEMKAPAPIAPFQRLSFLDSNVFNAQTIATFHPVLIGRSMRARAHVFIDPKCEDESLTKLPLNRINANDGPEFFLKNKECNWILECSIDLSHFKKVNEHQDNVCRIQELELENKYVDIKEGRFILNSFGVQLRNEFGIQRELASKFKQATSYFLTEK